MDSLLNGVDRKPPRVRALSCPFLVAFAHTFAKQASRQVQVFQQAHSMAPSVVLAKAQRMAAARSSGVEGKGKGKRRMSEVEEVEDDAAIPSDEDEAVSDDDVDTAIAPAPAKRARLQSQSAENGRSDGRATTGTFKQKTLILSSRGITHRMRHMMKDIAALLPHSKTGRSSKPSSTFLPPSKVLTTGSTSFAHGPDFLSGPCTVPRMGC